MSVLLTNSDATIFISTANIVQPDFFTIYYNALGEKYHRIENRIDVHSFDKDCSAVRIELYNNKLFDKLHKPVQVDVIYRTC